LRSACATATSCCTANWDSGGHLQC
jgi:hypothetical protein